MNLSKLFEMQKVLDDRIIREKGVEGQDLLPNTILALQVELGELANEWRGFKHWSNDREPRREKMLVEYVDCLHFILSLNLSENPDIPYDHPWYTYDLDDGETVVLQFQRCFDDISQFHIDGDVYNIHELMRDFLSLGRILGFTWDEIEQAYMAKNAVNHERQATGY